MMPLVAIDPGQRADDLDDFDGDRILPPSGTSSQKDWA